MINATGEAAREVVKGLSSSPMLLALLSLNAIGIGVAVWYLNNINHRNAELFTVLLKSCLPGGNT